MKDAVENPLWAVAHLSTRTQAAFPVSVGMDGQTIDWTGNPLGPSDLEFMVASANAVRRLLGQGAGLSTTDDRSEIDELEHELDQANRAFEDLKEELLAMLDGWRLEAKTATGETTATWEAAIEELSDALRT